MQFISQEATFWTREEALSDLAAVKFIELGEREVEEVRHVLAEENFFSRTLRHLTELKVCCVAYKLFSVLMSRICQPIVTALVSA